ncbi:hypothetical protein [Halorhabdus sp. SVX81]|uniref:hypothetical protein n=1 Tax=Halorhabdus sp. SVX81 TaxID=2978283 RepID=UPI0023DBBACD|nr:hypothetical protein [Halorhabdus sp. SVX81]
MAATGTGAATEAEVETLAGKEVNSTEYCDSDVETLPGEVLVASTSSSWEYDIILPNAGTANDVGTCWDSSPKGLDIDSDDGVTVVDNQVYGKVSENNEDRYWLPHEIGEIIAVHQESGSAVQFDLNTVASGGINGSGDNDKHNSEVVEGDLLASGARRAVVRKIRGDESFNYSFNISEIVYVEGEDSGYSYIEQDVPVVRKAETTDSEDEVLGHYTAMGQVSGPEGVDNWEVGVASPVAWVQISDPNGEYGGLEVRFDPD